MEKKHIPIVLVITLLLSYSVPTVEAISLTKYYTESELLNNQTAVESSGDGESMNDETSESSIDTESMNNETSESYGDTESMNNETSESYGDDSDEYARKDSEVGTWAEFTKALADKTVEKITLTADIKATANAPVSRDVEIDGDGHTIDFSTRSISITAGEVTIGNVNLSGDAKATAGMFIGAGKLKFIGEISTPVNNAAPIAKMAASTVTFENAVADIYVNSLVAILAKNLVTTGGEITVHSPFFYQTTATGSTVESKGTLWNFLVSATAKLTGGLWDFNGTSTVHFDGDSSVNIDIKLKEAGSLTGASLYNLFDVKKKSAILFEAPIVGVSHDATIFNMKITGSSLIIQGESSNSTITGAGEAFVKAEASGVTVAFKDKAVVDYTMDHERAAEAHGIWSSAGGLSFELDGEAKLDLKKTVGSGVAVYMEKTKNDITVRGGSDFIIFNEGDGKPSLDTKAVNHAVMYFGSSMTGGSGDFLLEGENSNVDLTANSGSALTTAYVTNDVTAKENTYFVARGKPLNTSGVIRSKYLNFDMNGLKYFDFKHMNDGQAINSLMESTFKTNNSDLSLWDYGKNVEGDPSSSWENLQLSTKGKDLEQLVSTNTPEFKKELERSITAGILTNVKGLMKYSRITGNNQAPTVEEVRLPTDADNRVFARATVPEGKYDPPRGVYEDEVTLTMQERSPEGDVIQEDTGKSKAFDYIPYSEDGEEFQGGLIEVKLGEFLTQGNKVEVKEGYRGNTQDEAHAIPPEKICEGEIVRDITPPTEEPIIKGKDKVSAESKFIEGNTTDGRYVTLYTKDQAQQSETIEISADGKFSVPMIEGMSAGDVLYVSVKDDAGDQSDILNPPVTNDVQGNQQPFGEFGYHDRQFTPSVEITLVDDVGTTGELDLIEVPKVFDYQEQVVQTTETTYWPEVTGALIVNDTRGDEKDEWRLTLKELIPLTNGSVNLSGNISYVKENEEQVITEAVSVVELHTHEDDGEYDISESWKKGESGLRMTVPPEKQFVGQFEGTFEWALESVPDNKEVGND